MRFLVIVVMSSFFAFGLHAEQSFEASVAQLVSSRTDTIGFVLRQLVKQERNIEEQVLLIQKLVENIALLQAQIDDIKAWRAGLERTVRLGSLVFLWHFVLAPVLYAGKRKKIEQNGEHVGVQKKLKKSKKLTQKLSIVLKRIMTRNKMTALLGAATVASAAHLMIRGN